MDLLDESKENIQPLRCGRNISTLSTALQAQTDAEIHQQLMKEREEFEILVRSYVGDDPLKPWYDYVLWVEQNFPKHGREGNLKILLENCLLQFKDNEQYSQDVRYIDLWTRYMSFADDPLQMYKQIHALGIGAQCAIFYQCWAEEYEKANDLKRADQIFIEGIRRNAQPKDELVYAHTNFQIRVARNILGQNPIMNQDSEIDERTALSTLRAHGRRKNLVDSSRVGNSIKHATPGVLRPHTNVPMADRRNGNVQGPKITVYNDENAPFTDAIAHPAVKTSVSLSQQKASNKENTLKPGRWNEGKFKKKSSAPAIGTSGVSATPRNPTFYVHVDENADVPKTPKTDIVASNVLKIKRHIYEDEKSIPIAMFEPPDPTKIAMYPKNKVYSGGTEFSLEELRAILYLKQEKERQKKNENEGRIDMKTEIGDADFQISGDEVVSIRGDQQYTSEEHQFHQQNVHQQEVIFSERTEVKQELIQKNSFEIYAEAEHEMNAKLKLRPLENVEQVERKTTETISHISLFKDVPAAGFLKVPKIGLGQKKRTVPPPADKFNSGPSFEQKESDQSLTVNTKEVLKDVNCFWVSSPQPEPNPPRVPFAPSSSTRTECISTPAGFTPFKIFSDTSTHEPEHVSSINVHVDKEPEGRQTEKERKVDLVGHSKQTFHSSASQKNVISRNLFHENGSFKQEPQAAEIQAFKQSPDSALHTENGSFKREPTSASQTSPDCVPLRFSEVPRDDFIVYKDPSVLFGREGDEMHKQTMEIPFVPSPGMTPAQLEALKGTEDKENVLRGKHEQMPLSSRSKKNILQPSKDVYFVPLEQQLAENDAAQENVLSDETCCTEAFAIPLVSSTPMVHPNLKTKVQEEWPREEDNTIDLLNLLKNAKTPKTMAPPQESSPKAKFNDQAEEVSEFPYPFSTPRISIPCSQLSTILESSERKKSSSMGTTDGSGASKSSGHETVSKYNITRKTISNPLELELQEEIEAFRSLEQNERCSYDSEPLMFFSGGFRNHCSENITFPSELHKTHCVQFHVPFDIDIRHGSIFAIDDNQYRVLNIESEKHGILYFIAMDMFSLVVNMELKDNAYLWEQYIREEIRHRLRDKTMIKHFHSNEKTYLYTNKFLKVYNKLNLMKLKDVLNNERNLDIHHVASEIIKMLFYLHQCKIIHGSLSVESFTLVSDFHILFLNNFENAVDMTLLPADTVFDATEKPIYYSLCASRLSPFQVDYIGLASVLHHLIFKEPMKVHKEMGKWCISSILPRGFDKNVWETLFRELLNNSDISLLHHCNALRKFCEV